MGLRESNRGASENGGGIAPFSVGTVAPTDSILKSQKMKMLSSSTKQYILITGNYWAFTLTDGALRMLVVLHFYQLGYTPLAIAMLFLFYEMFGVFTNLIGGWLGARLGLNRTMNIGLGIQIIALSMLLVPAEVLTVAWVMMAQALSGIAKDLNKMSAKSAIKLLVPKESADSKLYHWVAVLTGSKNTMKGFGFFLGAALLSSIGFQTSAAVMAMSLLLILFIGLTKLEKDLGKVASKPKFTQLLSKNSAVNYLSAARMFLFGARDIWFVVALPVYFSSQLNWDHWQVGMFMASWVIGYGIVQSISPRITGPSPQRKSVIFWTLGLSILTASISFLFIQYQNHAELLLVIGLIIFGIVFAVNSSLHSYLIVSYSSDRSISMDVGFYYMANAMGRLIGTILSGWIYQSHGLTACLWASAGFLFLAFLLSFGLPKSKFIR